MTQPPYIIRRATLEEVFDAPVFAELAAEYEAESLRNPDLAGSTVPDRAGYQALFEAGVLHPLGVYVGDELAGFCTVLLSPVLHHHGRLIAIMESLFVARAYRKGGAGRALLAAAERVAREQGALGLHINAPTGGVLERVLPRQGYRAVNQIFYRPLHKEEHP